jgi:polyphosphate kinase
MCEGEIGMAQPTMEVPPIEAPDAKGRINPALYINRELSWIAFDQRVLEEAQSSSNPLLERVKFAAIFHSNLDEFFMIRVSSIKEQVDAGITKRTPNGFTPTEQLAAIREQLLPLLAACETLVIDELLPALRTQGIVISPYNELSGPQRAGLEDYFRNEIFPILTPLAVDPSHRFPFISNLSLSLAVLLDDPTNGHRFARVKIPETLPRLVRVPELTELPVGERQPETYVWIEEVIAAHLHALFPGKRVRETYAFRVTRDVDLAIQDDEADDLLSTMEQNVRERRFGQAVRLELDANANPVIRDLLIKKLALDSSEVYATRGPLGLSGLMALYGIERPDLKDPPFVAATPTVLSEGSDIFAAIRKQDILLHHPFDSFGPVSGLIEAAARDPQVLAIKQTLYRVGRNSPVVQALLNAREEGKQVAVLVELKARFDEENNIGWARALEQAGVHVTYGLIGLKTHAKLLLIVRKEADGLRRYIHLGTGNYNAATARIYTDMGLLTCDEALGADMSELFNVLTGYSDQTKYRKLLVAPKELHKALLRKIDREIARHAEHGDGHLIFKCNGLTDEPMTMALYRASQAGVRVNLIIRGICSVRPGIPGLSETMEVRSVVGRFLEHHRIFYFHNGGESELYLGSADLMERNLHKRVEAVFPIENPQLRDDLRNTVLELYLRDNTQSRLLQSDGRYVHLTPGDTPPVNAQLELLEGVRG